MSAQGAANAKALIRMGTPNVTFSSGGSAKINGDGKDFAKSTYRTRLHRYLILSEKRIRYYRIFISIMMVIHCSCVYIPGFYIFYLGRINDTSVGLFVSGVFATIIICFKLPTLNKWKHKLKSTRAALDGEALDQYRPVRRNAAQRLIAHIANRYNLKQRRILAILQLIVFTSAIIALYFNNREYGFFLAATLIVVGIIFFSVIWPSKSSYQKRTAPTNDNNETI